MTKAEQQKLYQKLGELIREARISAGLNQETFSTYLNLSRASVVNIERGRQRPPIHLLWLIAEVLNIEVTKLLPTFTSSEKINDEWDEIIKSTVKNVKVGKEAKNKIASFVEDSLIKK